MLTTNLASDVAAYVLHETGEAPCVLRRQQQVVVITEEAHTKQLHLKALQSTREHPNYQRVDSLRGTRTGNGCGYSGQSQRRPTTLQVDNELGGTSETLDTRIVKRPIGQSAKVLLKNSSGT